MSSQTVRLAKIYLIMCQTCVIRILANGRIFSIKNPDIGHSSPPNIWLYQLKFSHSSSDIIVLHFGCNTS